MAQEEQAAELYDFLYRDSNRLTSYYSQIFQGKLSSLEELDSDTQKVTNKGKLSVQVAGAELSKDDEISSSSKRIIDPHDLIATDVLSYLVDGQYIHTDYLNAPNGSLVLVKGNLLFIDKSLIASTASIFTSMVENEMFEVNDPNVTIGVEVLQKILNDVPFPPLYVLETEEGVVVTGTVKEAGMEEPVSTHYFKYGNSGLPDVHLIGLKEIAVAPNPSSISAFMNGMQMVTHMLTNLLFPVASIKTTPLALFRKFEPFKENKVYFGSASRKNKQN